MQGQVAAHRGPFWRHQEGFAGHIPACCSFTVHFHIAGETCTCRQHVSCLMFGHKRLVRLQYCLILPDVLVSVLHEDGYQLLPLKSVKSIEL